MNISVYQSRSDLKHETIFASTYMKAIPVMHSRTLFRASTTQFSPQKTIDGHASACRAQVTLRHDESHRKMPTRRTHVVVVLRREKRYVTKDFHPLLGIASEAYYLSLGRTSLHSGDRDKPMALNTLVFENTVDKFDKLAVFSVSGILLPLSRSTRKFFALW